VFWSRYQELPDWEKVIKNIERGEQKIQRQADIMAAIRAKLEQYKNPWQELKVRRSAARAAVIFLFADALLGVQECCKERA
jgi:SWI/SNF-related matrix-associated actin-dependent regulator of chromatin subfamily A member 5